MDNSDQHHCTPYRVIIWAIPVLIIFMGLACTSRHIVTDFITYSAPFYMDSVTVGGIRWEYTHHAQTHDWGASYYEDVRQYLFTLDRESEDGISTTLLHSGASIPSRNQTAFYHKGIVVYSTTRGSNTQDIWLYNAQTGSNKLLFQGAVVLCASQNWSYIIVRHISTGMNKLIDYGGAVLHEFPFYTNPVMFLGDTSLVFSSTLEPYSITALDIENGTIDTLESIGLIKPFRLSSWHDFAVVLIGADLCEFRIVDGKAVSTPLTWAKNPSSGITYLAEGDMNTARTAIIRGGSQKSGEPQPRCIYENSSNQPEVSKAILCNSEVLK